MKSTNLKCMATTNRKLMLWFASDNPIIVFLKILPILVLLCYFLSQNFEINLMNILVFSAGIFTWSLFEYILHRWVYHQQFLSIKLRWFFDTFHLYHHQKLDDHQVLNAGFLLIYPLFIILFGISYLVFQSLEMSSFFCIGFVLYYFFYENIHYLLHYKIYQSGYLHFIQKYHLHHHYKNWNCNFGNTTIIWDVIFLTYSKEFKNFTFSEETKKHLIEKQ